MGVLEVCTRLVGVGVLAVMLVGCPTAQEPPQDRAPVSAGPGGAESIICPGDTRCGQVFASEAVERPQYQSCEIVDERVVMRCTGSGGGNNGPCPGTGCPTGQEPGLGNRCEIWRRYVQLNCPANDGSGPPPEQ